LLIALRMLAQLPGVDDRAAVMSAAAKLEEAANVAAAGRYVAIDVGVAPEVRQAVDEALRDHRRLTIEYAAATRDEVTTRTGVSYLEAHCLSAGALRTFRLDRVLGSVVGDRFEEPEAAGTASGTSAAPQGPRPPARTATLLLEPSARWIIDVHQATEEAQPRPDGRTQVSLPLHSDEWGVRLVLSLRGAAVVTEPATLVEAVRAAAESALAAYSDPVR
jgi:proteasome accessory factor C